MNVILPEATIAGTPMQKLLRLNAPQIIESSRKLVGRQLSQFLEINDYATYVVENDTHFVLEFSLYSSTTDRFLSLYFKM